MKNRKSYKIISSPEKEDKGLFASYPWDMHIVNVEVDFRRWLYRGRPVLSHKSSDLFENADREEMVEIAKNACWVLSGEVSPKTLYSGVLCGLSRWFEFLDYYDTTHLPVRSWKQVNRRLFDAFVDWVKEYPTKQKERRTFSGAKSLYTQTKLVLNKVAQMGYFSIEAFPRNPFPGSNKAQKLSEPYSKEEMELLMKALYRDLHLIREGSFKTILPDKLFVYFIILAAKTGRNLTPLAEMQMNCLEPHPLRPETHYLLRLYKRRSHSLSIQQVRGRKDDENKISMIKADVKTLIDEVKELTKPFRDDLPEELRQYLFAYKKERKNKFTKEDFAMFTEKRVHRACLSFITRHELPFRLTTSRLRKTFATRMWELTGGDVVKVSQLLGNTPRVTDTHYLAVTPDMERRHKFVGKCLEIKLLGEENNLEIKNKLASEMGVSLEELEEILQGRNNTGVGRCSSPLYGRFAPKDGKRLCNNFLYCFRCPNQVVMESDLHRLFSFYWLIVKEKNLLERSKWKKVYGWALREIDQVIAHKFNQKVVEEARALAKVKPHPLWKDRALLGSIDG